MATEYTLMRDDGKPFGSFAEVQALIRTVFPSVRFGWTASGRVKLRVADERGIELPPAIRQSMETAPSLLEGLAEGSGFRVEFGLGYEEPVPCLYITPRGELAELEHRLDALSATVGAEFKVSGE